MAQFPVQCCPEVYDWEREGEIGREGGSDDDECLFLDLESD